MSQELKEQILKGVVTILLFTSVFFAARQAAVLVNEGEAETFYQSHLPNYKKPSTP